MMENCIVRTKRNRNGKFESLTVCHDIKQAFYRFEDSFINDDCLIVKQSEIGAIRRQLEENGYRLESL